MKRRLFKLVAALSLFLCVVITSFWIYSRGAVEDFRRFSYDREQRDIQETEVMYGQGAVGLTYHHYHQTGGVVVDRDLATGTYFQHDRTDVSVYRMVDASLARFSRFGFVGITRTY